MLMNGTNKPSVCRGCGKKIVWVEDNNGKKIPLDPVAPVYQIDIAAAALAPGCTKIATRRKDCMVSHFATCPDANKFSGKTKKDAKDPSGRNRLRDYQPSLPGGIS